MQFKHLHPKIDQLQAVFGDKSLCAVYGTGCIKNAKVMLVFMNPTAKNISTDKNWIGLRAPWLGTKNTWRFLAKLGLFDHTILQKIEKLKPSQWTDKFCYEVYTNLAKHSVFLTNLAKCTQLDARGLNDKVFRNYMPILQSEIRAVKPEAIIALGNQVSSVVLGKSIKVGDYKNTEHEILKLDGREFKVFPVFYPVGQGTRNMPLAAKRISKIIANIT